MTDTTLRQATDGARYVKWADHSPYFVVWSGGTTFNVYHSHIEGVEEVDVFTVSDAKGRPLDAEEARERVQEHLAEMDRLP